MNRDKRRIVLLVIMGGSLLVFFLGASGLLRPHQEPPPDPDHGESSEEPAQATSDAEDLVPQLRDFEMPSYDSEGHKLWVLRGKRALLLKNGVYDITEPMVEVLAQPGKDGEAQRTTVVIKSLRGRLRKATREAELTDNVTVQFDDDTTLATDHVTYDPASNQASTDAAVTIHTRDLTITGRGALLEPASQRFALLADVKVIVKNLGGALLSDRKELGKQKAAAPVEEMRILCDDRLVYQREAEAATLEKNVRVSRGAQRAFAEKLFVLFDTQTKTTKKVIAQGNVRFFDAERKGNGDKLTWDVGSRVLSLSGAPRATVTMRDNVVGAEQMVFGQESGQLIAHGAGHLTGRLRGAGGKAAGAPAEIMEVTWGEHAIFNAEEHNATFTKEVRAKRGSATMEADELVVTFDEENRNITNVRATKNVALVSNGWRARGTEGSWNPDSGAAVLVGEPWTEIRDGDSQLLCKRLVFHQNAGRATAKGEGKLKVNRADLKDDAGQPLQIEASWTDEMELRSRENRATFLGRVRASIGTSQLRADRVDAHFKSGGSIRRVVATGNVTVVQAAQKGEGSRFSWDMETNTITLTGEPYAKVIRDAYLLRGPRICIQQGADSATVEGAGYLAVTLEPEVQKDGPLKTNLVEVEWKERAAFGHKVQKAEFFGDVSVKSGDSKLETDRLVLHLAAANRIRQIEAAGSVCILDRGCQLIGDKLTWDWATDLLQLVGDPEAEARYQGIVQFGQKFVFDRKAGKLSVSGATRPAKIKLYPDKLRKKRDENREK